MVFDFPAPRPKGGQPSDRPAAPLDLNPAGSWQLAAGKRRIGETGRGSDGEPCAERRATGMRRQQRAAGRGRIECGIGTKSRGPRDLWSTGPSVNGVIGRQPLKRDYLGSETTCHFREWPPQHHDGNLEGDQLCLLSHSLFGTEARTGPWRGAISSVNWRVAAEEPPEFRATVMRFRP